jgi:aryl-alcohol dehydrogenase-like predicted oxidoreductase
MSSRLALGTAQFGQAYGVANRSGQVGHADAGVILARARDAGIDTIDTAIAYGESEQRLGEVGVDGWRIVSKLPGLPDDCGDVGRWVNDCVRQSLRRLRVDRLDGLLLHRPAQLAGARGEELYRSLSALKYREIVGKIGISIYDPEELDALEPCYSIDVVQAPLSVVDRRLATSGWLARLRNNGTEIHVRSVFLQGVLLMSRDVRPPYFRRWQRLWDEWDTWLEQNGTTALDACIAFVASFQEVDRFVIGVDSSTQLEQLLSVRSAGIEAPPDSIASAEPDLVNPSRWRIN